MNTNAIFRAQLFEYSNNPNIRGNTVSNLPLLLTLNEGSLIYLSQVIAKIYKLKANSSTSGLLRADAVTKTKYVVRSDHRFIDANELESLPDSMKSVGSGKTILSSSTTVQSEKPEEEFSFGFSRSFLRHSSRSWCQDKVKMISLY